MADGFTINIGGIEELEAKLAALELKLENVLYEATAEAAAVLAREAQINSGRGGDEFPHRITGNLMRSIKPVREIKSAAKCEIMVGSAMEYALRLEYGFSEKDKKGRKYNQPPRPYLRPALDENKDKMREAFRSRIERTVQGVGK